MEISLNYDILRPKPTHHFFHIYLLLLFLDFFTVVRQLRPIRVSITIDDILTSLYGYLI